NAHADAKSDLGPVDLSALAHSKRWLRLLHYKHSFPFGSLRSEAQPGPYFLSPSGAHDPLAELQADIAAFRSPDPAPIGPLKLHPQCAFPARYHYLKAELRWETPDVHCPELDAFLKKLGGDAISLVFSSAYPDSPPSMFGHTLIRVHSANREELLDY